MPDNFRVAIYYAARSCIELQNPTFVRGIVEVAIPLTVMPPQLATASVGDRLRIQFRAEGAKPSPMLKAVVSSNQKTLGRHILRFEILDWDKLARYWRIRIETPDGRG